MWHCFRTAPGRGPAGASRPGTSNGPGSPGAGHGPAADRPGSPSAAQAAGYRNKFTRLRGFSGGQGPGPGPGLPQSSVPLVLEGGVLGVRPSTSYLSQVGQLARRVESEDWVHSVYTRRAVMLCMQIACKAVRGLCG